MKRFTAMEAVMVVLWLLGLLVPVFGWPIAAQGMLFAGPAGWSAGSIIGNFLVKTYYS